MTGLLTVFAKEVTDNLRDRRTLLSSFSLALIGPVFFVGLMIFVMDRTLGEVDNPIQFTVVGAEHAPQLMQYLDSQNTEIEYADADQPKNLVESGEHQLVLVINQDYSDRYRQGFVNTLLVIYDSSEISATRRHLNSLRGMIMQYSQSVGSLRLLLRGTEPSLAVPIITQELDVASPAARALTILASLPYFLVLIIFMGGFYLAIDTTAGERDHGSLEPLLTQPISRQQLVLGKIGATALFATFSLIIFLVSLYFSIPFVPFERIGMALEIGALQLLKIFALALPLIVFAASLLTVVASFAKSYKEAQTYLTIIVLIPTLPLIMAQLLNVETSLELMFVPSLSQSSLMEDLIKSEPVEGFFVLISMVSTTIYTALLAWVAVKLYQRERILG